jgi:hypothetical protein
LANSAVTKTDKKQDNFYAQRRKKRLQLEQKIENKSVVENTTDAVIQEVKRIEIQNQQQAETFGAENVIKRGKSLRQINAMFGYDKPSSNW